MRHAKESHKLSFFLFFNINNPYIINVDHYERKNIKKMNLLDHENIIKQMHLEKVPTVVFEVKTLEHPNRRDEEIMSGKYHGVFFSYGKLDDGYPVLTLAYTGVGKYYMFYARLNEGNSIKSMKILIDELLDIIHGRYIYILINGEDVIGAYKEYDTALENSREIEGSQIVTEYLQ